MWVGSIKNQKTKSHSSTLGYRSPGMHGSTFDRREYVASCVALYRRTGAQTGRRFGTGAACCSRGLEGQAISGVRTYWLRR
jgi:hypothetical protein